MKRRFQDLRGARALRRAFSLALALCMCFGACALFAACSGEGGAKVSFPVTIRVLNVGKADCILIETGTHLAVIDTGSKDTALTVADTVRKAGNKIDALIITHYDKDHIGGVKKLVKKNGIAKAYLPAFEIKETADDVKSALSSAGVTCESVGKTVSFTLDDAQFTIYPSSINSLDDDDDASNISSLVILMKHGKKSYLFASDAEKSRLTEVLDQLGGDARVDFLKVPHHGKYCGKSDKFFEKTSPEYAVISTSKSDKPDAAVVTKLENVGAKVYYTYEGTVTVTGDGKNITVKYGT